VADFRRDSHTASLGVLCFGIPHQESEQGHVRVTRRRVEGSENFLISTHKVTDNVEHNLLVREALLSIRSLQQSDERCDEHGGLKAYSQLLQESLASHEV